MTEAAQAHETAKHLLRDGRGLEALHHAEQAFKAMPAVPRYRSMFARLHAEQRGMVTEALELCREAIAREPECADLYCDLGHVYLKAKQKADAVAAFRAGIDRDPCHSEIQAALNGLGLRRKPVVGFLPRTHLLNRLLGRLTAALGYRQEQPNSGEDGADVG